MGQSVIVLEKDPGLARSLADGLCPHFAVQLINTHEELQDRLANGHAEAVVLNIEYCQLAEVQSLHRNFPQMPIICTHRVPDEEMWMAALEAGASDVCPADDVQNVLKCVLRSMALSSTAAA